MKYPILCNCKMKNLNSEIYFILKCYLVLLCKLWHETIPVKTLAVIVIHVTKIFFVIASKELFVH